MTNSPSIAARITRTSSQKQKERMMVDRKTICNDIRQGLADQKEVDDAMDIDALDWQEEEQYFDAITGVQLNPELVKIARQEEILYYRMMEVYSKVNKAVAFEKTGKPPKKGTAVATCTYM